MSIIERIEKISKKKKTKSYLILEFLWSRYQFEDKPTIFYRFNKKWMNFTVRELRDDLGVSVGMINKMLSLLKSEELIEYEFVSNKGYGKRNTTHDNKCIFFTAKGRALFGDLFLEIDCSTEDAKEGDKNHWETGDDSQAKKKVNAINSKAVYIDNNYYYYKSQKECSFSSLEGLEGVESTNSEAWKRSEHAEWCATKSLTARAWAIIQANVPHFQTVKLTKGMSRYIHAALNKLACKKKIGNGISTDSLLDRFSRFIKEQFRWIEEKGVKLTLHVLLHFKGIGAFLYRIFSGKWFDSNYDSHKTEQDQNLGGLDSKKVQTYSENVKRPQIVLDAKITESNGVIDKTISEICDSLNLKKAVAPNKPKESVDRSSYKNLTKDMTLEEKKAYYARAMSEMDQKPKQKTVSETYQDPTKGMSLEEKKVYLASCLGTVAANEKPYKKTSFVSQDTETIIETVSKPLGCEEQKPWWTDLDLLMSQYKV